MKTEKSNGQTALITGATSGIGLELAKCFAEDGYNLILVARHREELNKTAEELSNGYAVKVESIACDLMRREETERLCKEINARNIQVDVLVNDAGQGIWGKFTDTDLERELDIIQLNIVSLVILTKFFLKKMVDRKSGKILQLASVVSKSASPLLSVYAGTKAFVYNFTQSLINELEDTGVTMTALLPGATDTDFFRKAGSEHTVAYRETGLADPADVARDGYEALMAGKSKIISGFKNKMNSAMSNLMSDEMVAEQGRKQNEPSTKEEKESEPS